MNWARMLAYITGTVDQELLVRNEYLAAENPTRSASPGIPLFPLPTQERLRFLTTRHVPKS